MHIETITTPDVLPLLLAEVKQHLRLDGEDQDSGLGAQLMAAVAAVEAHTSLALISRQSRIIFKKPFYGTHAEKGWWDGIVDGPITHHHADWVPLPLRPLISVDAVELISKEGAIVLPASRYDVVTGLHPAIRFSGTLPAGSDLRMTVTSGFGVSWNDIPADIRQALLLLITAFYTRRGDMTGGKSNLIKECGAAALLMPYEQVRV